MKRTPEPITTTTAKGKEVTVKPRQVLIGETVIDKTSQVYRNVVKLLITEGHLAEGTKVEDVFALPPAEFSAITGTVRALIADNKIVNGEDGGPCNKTPDQAIAFAEKLKPFMRYLGEARCRLLGKLTLQRLQILEDEAALETACKQIYPFFTNTQALKTDETTRQISMIPAERFEALGVETIKDIKPEALHEAIIIQEDKLKAVRTENLARMEEDTIRGIRMYLPVKRIDAIGGHNLVGVRCSTIQIVSKLSDEVFEAFTARDLVKMSREKLQAITNLTIEQIRLITADVLTETREIDIYRINMYAKIPLDTLRELDPIELQEMRPRRLEKLAPQK